MVGFCWGFGKPSDDPEKGALISLTPGRIPRSGLVWSSLVSGGVGVGRWGGSGCGGLMGRVVWTVGWFILAVPHPVVVWEVVVNKDSGM